MAQPARPGPRDARGYVDLVLGRRDVRAAHVILREHEHDRSIPAEVFASFWEQYDELEHLRERVALDETSRVVSTRPARLNEEALSVISRAMDVFESRVESLSWAERRAIALSLERYAALESHLSVIRPSLRDNFLKELLSAAQHVHEQVKLVCSSGGERLAFSHAEISSTAVPLSPPVSSSSSHRAHHQLDVTAERTPGLSHKVHARLASDGEGQGAPSSSLVAKPDRLAENTPGPQRRFRDEDEGWNYATLVYESDQAPLPAAGARDSADERTAVFLPTDVSPQVSVTQAAAPPALARPSSVLAVTDVSASPPEQHGERAETLPAIRTDHASSATSSSRLLASPGQPGGPTYSRFGEELNYYNTWSRSSAARKTPVPSHAPAVVTSDVADEARHAEPSCKASDNDVSAAPDNPGEIDLLSRDCPDSAIFDILVDTTPPVHTSRRQRESRAKNSTVAPSAVDELPAIPRMSSHISVADSDELPSLIPYKRFPPKTGRYQSNAPTMPRSSTDDAPPAGQTASSQAPALVASGNTPLLPASDSRKARATTIPPEHSDTDADDTDSYNVVTDPEDNYTPAHFNKPTSTPAVPRPASPRQGSSRIAPARLDANQCKEAAKRVHRDVLAKFTGSGLNEVEGLLQFKNLGGVSAPAAPTSWVRTGLARVGLSKKRSIVRAL